MSKSKFTLYCNWDPESDSAAVHGERARASMKMFGELIPRLQSWYVLDRDAMEILPVEDAGNAIAQIVDRGLAAESEPNPLGRTAIFKVIGAGRRSFRGVCAATLTVEFEGAPDPEIVSYPIFKSVMTSLAPIWNATYVRADTNAIRECWERPPRIFDLSWMIYLSESFAHMIALPENVHVEPVTGGGVVLSAVEGDFDVANPEHMAAARRMRDALNPLNSLYKMP